MTVSSLLSAKISVVDKRYTWKDLGGTPTDGGQMASPSPETSQLVQVGDNGCPKRSYQSYERYQNWDRDLMRPLDV